MGKSGNAIGSAAPVTPGTQRRHLADEISSRKAVQFIKKVKKRHDHRHEVEEERQHHQENVEFAEQAKNAFGSRAVGGVRPDDEKKYAQIESTDYLRPDTPQEESFQRTFTPNMRTRRRIYIWGLYLCLGVAVAAEIIVILHLCEVILKVRVKATNAQLEDNELLMAWVVWTGSSMALCMIACALVLWQPAAASSGIPGLIAYLNGVTPIGGTSPLTGKKTGFLSFNCLVAKSIGMTLSIPSGLCLGPEGPIIHIGALLAHHTTAFFQTLSHKLLPERLHFSVLPGEGRDFLATGAAVGICVAFRAPLAGCLFVVEEASSFFTTEHLEYTFFATVIAYMVALALAQPESNFTKFKQTTGYFCTQFDWFDMCAPHIHFPSPTQCTTQCEDRCSAWRCTHFALLISQHTICRGRCGRWSRRRFVQPYR